MCADKVERLWESVWRRSRGRRAGGVEAFGGGYKGRLPVGGLHRGDDRGRGRGRWQKRFRIFRHQRDRTGHAVMFVAVAELRHVRAGNPLREQEREGEQKRGDVAADGHGGACSIR